MAYKNKAYVAFDGDNDIRYYRLMQAWKQSDHSTFNFFDAHDINNLRNWSSEETIKKKLKERLNNSKVFILLIGEQTRFHYKFVKWEIEKAIDLNLPIICVNINGQRSLDSNLCPPVLRGKLALHISFNAKIIEKAMENWEYWHYEHQKNGKTGDFYYDSEYYKKLGL